MPKFEKITHCNYWIWYFDYPKHLVTYYSVLAKSKKQAIDMFKKAVPEGEYYTTWNVTTFKHNS